MSKLLVDALEAIRDHAQHHALFAVRSMAAEALAAHRASSLVDDADETLRTKLRDVFIANGGGRMRASATDEVLRLVDEHLGRGQR